MTSALQSKDVPPHIDTADPVVHDDMKNEKVDSNTNRDLPQMQDPGLWPAKLNSGYRNYLLEKGPVQTTLQTYPKDESNRSFSNVYYKRKMVKSWIESGLFTQKLHMQFFVFHARFLLWKLQVSLGMKD